MFRASHLVNKWKRIERAPYNKELDRLITNPTINRRLLEVSKCEDCQFSMNHRIAFGRSLEVFNIFKETHYVFHHGQCGAVFLPLNILTKIVMDKQFNAIPSPHETFLRHPIQTQNINRDIKFYTEHIKPGNIHKHSDNIYTRELLSVDAHLSSTAMAESAFRHLIARGHRGTHIRDIAINEIASLCNDKSNFLEEFNTVQDVIYNLNWYGILYAICVEKSYFPQCGYLSVPVGIAYPEEYKIKYYNTTNDDIILDKMQNTYEHTCDYVTPQVRLLTHKLDPQYVKAFVFPAMTDDKYTHSVDLVQSVVNKYFC
jgi:hypothetical protein